MAGARRQFTRDDKLEILAPILAGERGVGEVSKQWRIHDSVLQRWLAELARAGDEAFPGSGRPDPAQAELVALRRRLADAEQQIAILKNALAYFSRDGQP